MSDSITHRGVVYPWQCDHVGHMNVTWYVAKFDEATWNLFAGLGVTASYLRDNRRGMAAVQQNISYRRELLPGDVVVVRSRVLEIREKVIWFEHEMRRAERDEVAATCELTAVHLDADLRKACSFPDGIRAAARARMAADGAGPQGPDAPARA